MPRLHQSSPAVRSRSTKILLRLGVCVVAAAAFGTACDDDTPCPDSGHDAAVVTDMALSPVKLGEMVAAKNGCHGCHDPNDAMAGVLSGKSVPLTGSMSYPPNITPDTDSGIGSWSDEDIARAVRAGVDDEAKPLCPTMPKFTISDADMANLIAYLRSVPAVKNTVPDSICPPVKM